MTSPRHSIFSHTPDSIPQPRDDKNKLKKSELDRAVANLSLKEGSLGSSQAQPKVTRMEVKQSHRPCQTKALPRTGHFESAEELARLKRSSSEFSPAPIGGGAPIILGTGYTYFGGRGLSLINYKSLQQSGAGGSSSDI